MTELERAEIPKATGMENGPILRAEGLHRWLGMEEERTHVLRGVDVTLSPGRIYAVVGASGCGKSTLLYLLGLLDRPDGGEIWLRGRPMARVADAERTSARNKHVGFVFQFHFLLPEFSALENVTLPMKKLRRIPETEANEQAAELLSRFGLGDKMRRLANHLSGGEKQRVAIARSLANQPTLVLADEPTGNLDERNSEIVFGMLTRVAHEFGKAVLVVTHNLELAARCDQTLPMRDGLFIEPSG